MGYTVPLFMLVMKLILKLKHKSSYKVQQC